MIRRNTGRGLVGLALVSASLAVLVGGASGCTPKKAAPADVAPEGSYYMIDANGSILSAEFLMQRSRRAASGASTLTIGVKLSAMKDLGGAYKVVGTELPEYVIEGISGSGKITELSGSPVSGAVSMEGAPWGGRAIETGMVELPSRTRKVRMTIHLGKTRAEARRGLSVTVPVSAIPVMADLQPIHPFGSSPSF
jgi:hypothetical protein